MQREKIKTICGFCHLSCGMVAELEGGRWISLHGDRSHPANEGSLCIKGVHARDVVYARDRLTRPLKKTKVGFKQISWNEALTEIAERLGEIREKWGPKYLALCKGAPVTEDSRDGFAQFMAAFGSPNITGVDYLCSVPRGLAHQIVYGQRTDPEYENTRFMIFWGANPLDSNRLGVRMVYGGVNKVLDRLQRNGVKMVVIDPIPTKMALRADEWIPIRLGTDGAFILAMIHTIIKENFYDLEFVREWGYGFEKLEEWVEPFSPEWAEEITGISASKIKSLAMEYAQIKPGVIFEGNGLDQHPQVFQTVRGIAMLRALTGNLDIPGGDIFYPTVPLAPIPTISVIDKPIGKETYPLFPSIPFPVVTESILTGSPYPLKAMLVHHANPLLVNANEKRVRQALEKLELLVVCDIFKTATAELAHFILPETSDFEKFSFRTYSSSQGGLVSLRRKVIDPLGECKDIFEIELDLAKELGLTNSYPWRNALEWVDYRLSPTGIRSQDFSENSFIVATPFSKYGESRQKGFKTPSGKVEFYSETMKKHGYDPLPSFNERLLQRSEKYPFSGTTRRPGVYVHTKFRNVPEIEKFHPSPVLEVHPEEALKRKIKEGDRVEVESPTGRISLRITFQEKMKPGLALVDFGWGNPWDEGPNVNLITDDSNCDPVTGTTGNREFFCRINPKPEE